MKIGRERAVSTEIFLVQIQMIVCTDFDAEWYVSPVYRGYDTRFITLVVALLWSMWKTRNNMVVCFETPPKELQ